MSRILLVGTGRAMYRRYLLESIARDHEVVLVQSAPATWQAPLVATSYVLDPTDVPALVDLGRREQVDGVLTWSESCVSPVAATADRLGLPSHGEAAAGISRDKHLMRRRWERDGVPSARSVLVTGPTGMARVDDVGGFPVVVKPRALAGSMGVVRATDADGLDEALAVAAAAELSGYGGVVRGVLVEEYLDGPEYSVESLVVGGVVHVVAITAKTVGLPPGFEELGHEVPARVQDPAALIDTVRRAHESIGLADGATHAEVRMTPSGPRMIELAARLGGDFIPHLVRLATGVDLGRAAAAVAVGETPDLEPTRARSAIIRFAYPPTSGRVESLGELPAVDAEDETMWTVEPGDEVALPPDGFIGRVGYALAVDVDAARCADRVARLGDELEHRLLLRTAERDARELSGSRP